MRTTIDLPDDLHRIATSIARDQDITLSQAVASLVRRALATSDAVQLDPAGGSGLRFVRVGRPITSDDVRSLDDDE